MPKAKKVARRPRRAKESTLDTFQIVLDPLATERTSAHLTRLIDQQEMRSVGAGLVPARPLAQQAPVLL